MSGDLRTLAEKYVTLTEEIDDVRRDMLACLTNGAGANPVRPTPPVRSPPGGKSNRSRAQAQAHHPNAVKSQEIDEKVLTLLRSKGPMKTVEIAAAISSKMSTCSERLRRLRSRQLVIPAEDRGWVSAPSP
jgi:hypothetical protein